MESLVAEHCRPDAGSNFYEKAKDAIIEKVEREEWDAFMYDKF